MTEEDLKEAIADIETAVNLVQSIGHALDAQGELLRHPIRAERRREIGHRLTQSAENLQDVVHRLNGAVRKIRPTRIDPAEPVPPGEVLALL